MSSVQCRPALGGCKDVVVSTDEHVAFAAKLQLATPWEFLKQGGIASWAAASLTCKSLPQPGARPTPSHSFLFSSY